MSKVSKKHPKNIEKYRSAAAPKITRKGEKFYKKTPERMIQR